MVSLALNTSTGSHVMTSLQMYQQQRKLFLTKLFAGNYVLDVEKL